MRRNLFLVLIVFSLFAMFGCTEDTGPDYDSEIIKGQTAAESSSVLGAVVQEWRFFSVLFMLISIGLVGLAYMASTALDLPQVRAWADVELGEAFSTALIVMFIIAILIFAEAFTHLALIGSPDFEDVCTDTKTYCPAQVAKSYLNDYMDKTMGIYEDLQENAIKAGKMANIVTGAGTQYYLALFLSVTYKPTGNEIMTVNMIMQELQFLITLRDALIFQKFLINHISLTLAPLCLMLGIIMRSFFVTRKLGGQLIAFAIGFILVFPATYAISMYTVKTTIYGAAGSGGSPGGEFCTQTCVRLPPSAYDEDGNSYTWAGILKAFPQQEGESEEEYKNRTTEFITGKRCTITMVQEMKDTDYDGIPDTLMEVAHEDCTSVPTTILNDSGVEFTSCGKFDEMCPKMCRTLPYPNLDPTCASPRTEYMCREFVDEECFDIKFVDRNDPALSGLSPMDFDDCPTECRPLIGLKKEGCDTGYGFVMNAPETDTPTDIDGIMFDEGYSAPVTSEGYGGEDIHARLYRLCDAPFWAIGGDDCSSWMVDYIMDGNSTQVLQSYLNYEEISDGKTVEWDMGCPNHCRFVTTGGEVGFGCSECTDYPSDPQDLWDQAADGDFQDQLDAAEQTCSMIIPDIVFETPSACAECNYVLDRGFSSMPPIHLDCPRLCGQKGGVETRSNEGSLNSAVEGFDGPAEMKSISALAVPALILPLLNLVITFMFIRTVAPMIGGGIDISGMMRFFR